MTRIAQVVTDFIELFSRERAGTDTRRIGFDDTDDVFHTARTDTGTGAGTAGRRVRAGNERIRTVIQIEHRSLSPFKEDLLAFTDVEVGRVIRILYILADLIGIAEVFLEDFIVIEAWQP